eukprot:scaffold8065_cov267-Pinguiococcus_pyrenoidosus.AAC.5
MLSAPVCIASFHRRPPPQAINTRCAHQSSYEVLATYPSLKSRTKRRQPQVPRHGLGWLHHSLSYSSGFVEPRTKRRVARRPSYHHSVDLAASFCLLSSAFCLLPSAFCLLPSAMAFPPAGAPKTGLVPDAKDSLGPGSLASVRIGCAPFPCKAYHTSATATAV